MSNAILVFVKYPTPGKVKTRLAVTLGEDEAARIYRQMAEYVCARLPAAAVPIVMFDPPEKELAIEEWLRPILTPEAVFEAQAEGDLGARLADAFASALSVHARVTAIGTDCLDLDAGIFRECEAALEHSDCVIGPASDGGYYLIALKRDCRELFQDVPWSSPETLERTMEIACGAGLSVHLLPELHDVDTETDWNRVAEKLF